MKCLFWGSVLGILLAYASACFAQEKMIAPDLTKINDGKTWKLFNADCEAATEDGLSVVRMKPKVKEKTPSNVGLALVEGLEFGEGVFEVDLKGNGKREFSFLGVAFGAADGKNFEALYLRPFHFGTPRAVQYVAWPEHTWETLRKRKPGIFEVAVKPVPDSNAWFHARIEVTKKKVRVFVNDAKEPCLVVDRLASREKGKVGLWVDSQDGAFSNLKIVLAE